MRICGVGDNVVDRYVDRGTLYPGGNALNVAVHARRRGATAAYLGVLGDDEAGSAVARALSSEGVDTSMTRTVPGSNAYAVVRLVDGDRTFESGSAGVSKFTVTDAELAYLSTFDLVHTGDCSFLESQVPEIARACRVSFDFSDRPREYAAPLLPHVDIATFSAGHLPDRDVAELVRWAHESGAGTVIATRGAAGALVSDGNTSFQHGGRATSPVVDTLGAGDAFIAAMLVELLSGTPVEAALEAASAHAAQTCGHYGAFGHESLDTLPPPPGASSAVAAALAGTT